MIPLALSTASQEVLLPRFVDATDGVTEETALTIANTDIKIWKAGGTTVASKNSGGATHIANGLYYCVLDATDTNTLGPLIITINVSGARPVERLCMVGAVATAYDANPVALAGVAQSLTDLKDFADTGYDPSTHNVAEVDSVAALGTQAKADVNAEVVDTLAVDTYAQPSAVPAATASLTTMLRWFYLFARNRRKTDKDALLDTVYADNGVTVVSTAVISDNGAQFVREEYT